MEYEYLVRLRNHPSWRLLTADSSPFILSFFHRAFIRSNRRSIPAAELVDKLDDYLFHLHEIYGDGIFPRPPKEYLDSWAGDEHPFLRKYYPASGDKPEYDLTSASEKVFEWLSSLEQRQFVGAESRLLTIFRLLREIAGDSVIDPEERIRDLEEQKKELEAEIAFLKKGHIRPMDRTRIRERFLQADETARRLLSDFREIEENFRRLDRVTRERIATSELPKGRLLDEIFGEEDAIRGSDQGRSFQAFWTFLMSPASQEELDRLLSHVLGLPEIEGMSPDDGLRRISLRLLEAGEKVDRTCSLLVEQLRKFLDDRAWMENKRIMEIIRGIERLSVEIKQSQPQKKDFIMMDDLHPDIDLFMDRGLFRPAVHPSVDDEPETGTADFDTPDLYNRHYIDEDALRNRIRLALRNRPQISLADLLAIHPVEKGLSEVIAYLDIASRDDHNAIDTSVVKTVQWRDPDGRVRKAHMPEVIFTV